MTTTSIPQSAGSVVPSPSLITDTLALAGRGVRGMLRSPVALAVTAAFPVILLVLLSVSFADLVMPGAGYAAYVDYTVPLFAAMGITFAAASTATAVHADRTSGYDDRLRTLPISPVAPLAGQVLADGLRNLASVVIVTGVGVVLGFRFGSLPLDVLGYFALPLVYVFGLAWVMVALAVHARSADGVIAMANVVMLVLSFLSTGFVTIDDLPGWAQPLARVNPVTQLVESMRGFAGSGGEVGDHVLGVLAWTVGLTVVFGLIAVRGLRRERRR